MKQPKVLVADDDRKLLQLLAIQLKAAGFAVICAQDGYQAVDFARHEAPDVIVLDVNMPAGDGFSVQERLSKMTDVVSAPVIYLTGDRSNRVAESTSACGAYSVVYKPFETTVLIA